jgi:3-hydroxybutyryl-CoA dehydratase
MKVLKLGEVFKITRKFTQEEVLLFSKLSGDKNPLHYDREFCKTSIFKKPIIHGMLGASLFSDLLGNNITGAIYMYQNLKFLKPIFVDEDIEAIVTLEKVIKEKSQLQLGTRVFKKINRELAIDGEALIKYPSEKYNVTI